jgi:hypothetical protein
LVDGLAATASRLLRTSRVEEDIRTNTAHTYYIFSFRFNIRETITQQESTTVPPLG